MGTTPGLAPREGVRACVPKSLVGGGASLKGAFARLVYQRIYPVESSNHWSGDKVVTFPRIWLGATRERLTWSCLFLFLFLFLFLLAHNHFKATRLPCWRYMPSEIGSKKERGHAELSLVDEEQVRTRDPCGTKLWVVLLDHHPQSLWGLVQHMMRNLIAIS
jgi:hypothetical protein